MKRFSLFASFFLLLAGLVISIIYLFQLQLDQGSSYPPYSTFRSDPQGAKILLETLKLWSDGKASPLLNRTWERPSGDHATWILLNAESSPTFLNKIDGKGMKEFLNQGGRLVIAFKGSPPKKSSTPTLPPPSEQSPSSDAPEPNNKGEPTNEIIPPSESSIDNANDNSTTLPTEAEKIQKEAEEKRAIREKAEREYQLHLDKNFWDIEKEWGFELRAFELKRDPTIKTRSEEPDPLTAIPQGPWEKQKLPELPWHSPLYFLAPDPNWKIRYTVNDQPAIIERDYEGGTVVLLGDPSLMSNQSLSQLVHWQPILPILGVGRFYWFDETHLNVSKHFSLVQLMKRSGGTGFMIGLLLLFLLWVWKNQSILAPLPETIHLQKSLIRSPSENLRQLFRFHLRGEKLWQGMIHEWKRTSKSKESNALAQKALERLPSLLKQKPKLPPTEIYRTISEILNERNTHGIET